MMHLCNPPGPALRMPTVTQRTRYFPQTVVVRHGRYTISRKTTVIAHIHVTTKINQEIDKFVDLKTVIISAIDELDDLEERILLRAKYISRKSWDDIFEQLNRSRSATYRVHASALEHFKIPTKVEMKRD